MRVLLDTHDFLWWAADDPKLSEMARSIIGDPDNEIFFSVTSAQEIIIKNRLGKLPLPEPVASFIPNRIAYYQFQTLLVTMSHILQLAHLEQHHKDPFDRLLIAQSQVEHLPLLTIDNAISPYDVDVIW